MLFSFIASKISKDLAIDLGTANTLVYARGKGIVLNEPSVVAIRRKDKRNSEVWVGEDAKKIDRAGSGFHRGISPAQRGRHRHFEIASLMLKFFIQKDHERKSFVKPRVIISVPAVSPRWKEGRPGLGPQRRRPRGLYRGRSVAAAMGPVFLSPSR